ncbi:MAG: 2-oxoacid:acceptor oxidoreductase family protein [Planctomycetota bacterium]|nr:2-oxoacid:acceptor oxidoreductase family protein [Planctomycetota bacterium]
MKAKPRYPGIRLTTNGNQFVSYYTEARVADGGVFYPITPSTEMGENFQLAFAEGKLNVFGQYKVAIEAEGEHAAQGGAIALSTTGRRVVNFTSGQGLIYGLEQYYHAPAKLSTMIVQIGARALTKHALNVHCGHDDIYAAMDTGWIMLVGKDAQQAGDQALILRRVTEKALNPGLNVQDGFLTTHLERTFRMCESELIREFLGHPDDEIECPTEAQRELFGPTRRRVPRVIDLTNPALIGPVQNQEHYMNGVVARRNNFAEEILPMLEEAYEEFGRLTGRHYGLISKYRTDDADYVFISLGSAAENIEAGVDYLRKERGAKVGSIHVNVLRPFPVAAIVEALKGKKACIILERTDEPLSPDNPLAREVRTALTKSYIHPGFPHRAGYPTLTHEEVPRNFSGVYGLGSRDFRPEHILGAYEYVADGRKRQDGKGAADGVTFFYLGVDHPYAVCSDDTPPFLPEGAISVRMHSIGGWGMITTGKNLGEIIGNFGDFVAERDNAVDEFGERKEVIHVSANPKYGSEKKGAPTSYFLVVAPERIRVNCDLRHVDAVLCPDPKAFLHTNPLAGMREGGAFVWESTESPDKAWERIPKKYRQEILDKKIRIFVLNGFKIARESTDRPDLQLRMQGNAFLGGFFRVSSFLNDYGIGTEHFHQVVRDQYVKKFGRLGEAVVESNMQVMTKGFDQTQEIVYGDVDAPDRSSMQGSPLVPLDGDVRRLNGEATTEWDVHRPPVFSLDYFDGEFRSGFGYHQPSSPLASVGVMAAATGATASKAVSRRQSPLFIPENCTQCMACIAICPDTAMPNTAQGIGTVLGAAIRHYVSNISDRDKLLNAVPDLEAKAREKMLEAARAKEAVPFAQIVRDVVNEHDGVSEKAKNELFGIIDILPLAYTKANAIFSSVEKKSPGEGGLFSIFINDRCKGCGACVHECPADALRMEPDSEEVNTRNASTRAFLDLLPETPRKYLGLYDPEHPEDSKAAALRNHLMLRGNYEAMVCGDGSCAGCGEKSVLHSVSSVTEAFMRPLYHQRADRLDDKAQRLADEGAKRLAALSKKNPDEYRLFKRAVAHLLMQLGGESAEDTDTRLARHGDISDGQIIDALITVLRQDAFNHRDLQAVDGRLANGMACMAMGCHTGCNTVYGSTPPNNPHPYPWMNSLFQDGVTISWLMGEGFIQDHARRSVVPERLATALLERDESVITDDEYFDLCHFTDIMMTDREILELPKAWAVGGDGGMGDIGFQNSSKVILQNRPNVMVLMLDTQVYSNTGGQNSDSSPAPGGFDMNQFGAATEGKLTEKKSAAETFTVGHGSPFIAQISMANAAKFYKAILDGLTYRGTGFYQCFSSCLAEHGVGDDMAIIQAQRIRDSRGLPEFTFNSGDSELYGEAMNLKGNPDIDKDWWTTKFKSTKEAYKYTVAHWAMTEARFRRHFKTIKEEQAKEMIPLEDILIRLTQADITRRRFLDPTHRAYVPDFEVYIQAERNDGKIVYLSLSRQMVLFAVERRKAWRMLQSRSGIENLEAKAQLALVKKCDADEISLDDLKTRGQELFEAELAALGGGAKPAKKKQPVAV